MKIAAIIQARTSSTRLPKKVLKHLPYDLDITVLEQVIRRAKKSKNLDEIIIATTKDKEDEEIVNIAKKEDVKWFRGSKENVLERYYLAAKENSIDIVVRITSDCPCIDYNIIDEIVAKHIKEDADYTSNTIKRLYPHGVDVEVISFEALEEAYCRATKDFEKEHVCPYIHTTNRDRFKIVSLEAPKELMAPDIRITLDTIEDYALLCAVFDYLYYENPFFDTKDIVELFNKKPWLKLINKKVMQKKVYFSIEEELKDARKLLKMQELYNALKLLER